MIDISHVVLPSPEQMEFMIEGMRNPLNSWDKSDSGRCCDIHRDACINNESCDDCTAECMHPWAAGPNDLDLMKRLDNGGPVHRKYMRMIPVFVRINAPLYWWKEFDTNKVGTVANSCSTMHKIQAKEFDISDFSVEHLFDAWLIEDIINELNKWREYYNNYDNLDERFKSEHSKKDIWWQIIQLLPSSYNQTRNVMLNYEVLAAMYRWRKDHKLDEWRKFCTWIESLPYSDLITMDYDKEQNNK